MKPGIETNGRSTTHLIPATRQSALRIPQSTSSAIRSPQSAIHPVPALIGHSQHADEIRHFIETASSDTRVHVLIQGETGTGKEVVARHLHAASDRRDMPFVKIDCSTIPEPLVESELFGHVKGAFTGALTNKRGKVELANGGTVFFDEINSLSPFSQPKLLALLQDGSFTPVGSTEERKLDAWIIVATNQDLHSLVQQGRFRPDLYYRIRAMSITLPPLRERPKDIIPLAHHFLQEFETPERPAPGLSAEAEWQLLNYSWPGNVRELKNMMEVASVKAWNGRIEPEHLSIEKVAGSSQDSDDLLSLAEVEKRHILKVMSLKGNNKHAAAEALGISRGALYNKLSKHKIGG